MDLEAAIRDMRLELAKINASISSLELISGERKGRGRPRKPFQSALTETVAPTKRRGRPPGSTKKRSS